MFEDWDMLIKSHQYSRKEFKNGAWRYYYDKHNNFSRLTHCNSTPLNVNASMSASAIVSAARDYIQNVWLLDWKAHPMRAICKELKGKTISFESISYKHLSTSGKHSINGKRKRDVQNLIDHVRYLPLAKELLEKNGVHTQSRYEEFSEAKKDGSIGIVYQTVSGVAPKDDKNNYVQVTVSQKKYADGKMGNMVYISVVGTKTIKKALAQGDLLSDFTHTQEQIAKSNASNYAKSCPGSAPSPISAFYDSSLPHNTYAVKKADNEKEKEIFDMQNVVKKAGLPVGTISGNYKKISDNPAKWEYCTQDEIFNNESGNERRAFLANKAELITDTQELPACKENYKAVGTAYLFKMRNEVFTRDVICKANNKKIVDVDTKHIFKDKNTDANKTLRVRALPFVFPIIEKYGKKGLVTKRKDGVYTELVGKADITTKGGKKKRCAIAVILVTDKKNRQSLKQLSVFVVDNKVIKSLATDAPRTSRLVRSGFSPCASDSHSPACKNNIPHTRRAVKKIIRFEFENITQTNKYEKMEKAVRCLSKVLRVPIGIEKSEKRGESFVFKAQEDLTKKWFSFFDDCVNDIYDFTIKYFGLPKVNIVSKAASVDVSNLLVHRGKVIYNPETGQPVKKGDWTKFVKTLEKLMKQKYGFAAKRMINESQTLGRLLDRMLQAQENPSALKNINLDDLRYKNKTFDYIVQNNNAVFTPLSSFDLKRIELAQLSAGEKITRFTDSLKSDVKQVLIDGIKERKSKNEVSQALFDRLSKENRDFRKIADTELQNNYNNAFLTEEVRHAKEGEKVYFKRLEILDGATCPFCRKMNGKIALWSSTPLASDKINDDEADVAIWEGKDWSGGKNEVASGVFHPWCRGMWIRYFPNGKKETSDKERKE